MDYRPGANSNIGTAVAARSDARRLHLAGDRTGGAGQPHALQGRRLGPDEGFQMRRPRGLEPKRGAGQSGDAGQDARRIRRLANAKPGQLNFGNAGTGSSTDLTAQKLFQVANIKLTNIGYKGQPPALVDLMTNRMNFEVVSLALALPHIKDGKVKPLAVFTEKRVADLPDVPTIAEAGYPGASYVPWYGIYVPAATPQPLSTRSTTASTRRCKIPTCSAARGRRHPGQPDVARRSRRPDEGGPREADRGGEGFRHQAAVEVPYVTSPCLQKAVEADLLHSGCDAKHRPANPEFVEAIALISRLSRRE